MATVVLEKLLKTYVDKSGGPVPVVHGIDLEVRDREFMVLVGPSGCGKSTTLRMIAGLESISGGRLLIDGAEMNRVAPKDRDIAMVFQNYALYPHMTVFENMAFGLKLRKLPTGEIAQRVRETSALLGLDPYLERRPQALSGGQRQRVAVGRAIVRKPKVFLFDEPLSNLDAKMRVSTRAEISKLHQRLGATMIYVTHDQVEAMTMGDRICVMKEGRIMQVAEPLELYNRPANLFVAGFIGSPPMNTLAGTLVSESGVQWFVAGEGAPFLRVALTSGLAALAAQATGPRVVLGIRPEDLHEASSAPAAWPRLAGRVDVMEPLGAETYVYATVGTWSLIARLPPSVRHAAGSTVELALDPAKMHLFDAATECALR